MALEKECARLLILLYEEKGEFGDIVTIGRQNSMVSNKEMVNLLKEFKYDVEKNKELLQGESLNKFSDSFFRFLGASKIDSLDVSDYEGASVIHDLNKSLPKKFKEKYDLVFDAGSLEHVFNLPMAISNCMSLVKEGGRYVLHVPANNYLGHGFHQFSPDFFFRTLSQDNGFVIEKMFLIEYGPRRKWYRVKDGGKKGLGGYAINSFPVYLFVQARKIESKKVFKNWPQQGSYSSVWAEESKPLAMPFISRLKSKIIKFSPGLGRTLDSLYHSSFNKKYSLANSSFYERVDKSKLIRESRP